MRVEFKIPTGEVRYDADMPMPPRVGEVVQFPNGRLVRVEAVRYELADLERDHKAVCQVTA